jgi:uncharacterized membrane protein
MLLMAGFSVVAAIWMAQQAGLAVTTGLVDALCVVLNSSCKQHHRAYQP